MGEVTPKSLTFGALMTDAMSRFIHGFILEMKLPRNVKSREICRHLLGVGARQEYTLSISRTLLSGYNSVE